LGQGSTPTAKYLDVSEQAYIFNDSVSSGNAGRTIFWSDDTTNFKPKLPHLSYVT
jgi:hypothetical protein